MIRGIIQRADVLFLWFPHVLFRREDGFYEILDRNWQQLGPALKLRIGPRTAAKLSCEGSGDRQVINLYLEDDLIGHPALMADYMRRLEVLARMRVIEVKD